MQTLLALLAPALAGEPVPGPWHAVLAGPLGDVPFELSIETRGGARFATIHNGAERIERPLEVGADGSARIVFPHYDAWIAARVAEEGRALEGVWTRRGSDGHERTLPFRARAGAAPRFQPAADDDGAGAAAAATIVAGRWSLEFDGEPDPAVLILAATEDGVAGTVLTGTGDHRFLAGAFRSGRLRLSCFDGAHAYLYDARLQADGSLAGRFAAGARPERAWSARRDDDAAIPDPFARARWASEPGLLWIEGLDASGAPRSLAEALRGARALVVQIAGSWCPNCHDELAWLAPLAAELAPRGLATVTLGFEAAGDPERGLRQLARMRERHGATHAFLLAGVADKRSAAAALGTLDHLAAFPTLAILGADGAPLAVHSGFTGPAAGVEHERALRELRARIEAALAREAPPSAALELLVAEGLWRDERDRTFLELRRDGAQVRFIEREMHRFDGPTRAEPLAEGTVEAQGDVLWIGADAWQLDRRAQVALDPRDLSHRLVPAARGPFPRVGDGRSLADALDDPAAIVAGLAAPDPVLRRECAWFLATQIALASFLPPDYAPRADPASASALLPLLDDPDPLVRATACRGAGLLRLASAREPLARNAEHPFPAVAREARRALDALGPR
ncbi:MAG: TlpA family protein disulfide reductase [Planctomycetes bacterium]|nr:TlpA family protein disulfide reductase [Planctomycetota bacterium]